MILILCHHLEALDLEGFLLDSKGVRLVCWVVCEPFLCGKSSTAFFNGKDISLQRPLGNKNAEVNEV